MIGKKSGIKEEDILILPVDITNLEFHQQYFDAVIKHFGTVCIMSFFNFHTNNIINLCISSWMYWSIMREGSHHFHLMINIFRTSKIKNVCRLNRIIN